MLKIKESVRVIKREKLPCPEDGVHVKGKEGFIKGVHSLYFGDRIVPKGATCFYWQIDDNVGLRIGYSFGWMKALKESVVERDYKIMKDCFKNGISPEPFGVEKVSLSLEYTHEKLIKINTVAFAIKVQHINYPKDAWALYAKGRPYDWNADDHKDHSPEGFKKFVSMSKPLAKNIDTSWKLGDVVWDVYKKRWYLVDCGK